MIEYGIKHIGVPERLHRGPMTEGEAKRWIREWEAAAAHPDSGVRAFNKGAFIIVERTVSPWGKSVINEST